MDVVGFFFFSSQSLLKCPGFPQLKHNPFFIISAHFSMLNASTSIASGSLLWKFHLLHGSSFGFVVFLPKIRCSLRKLLSSLEAHSYHSSKFFEGWVTLEGLVEGDSSMSF